MMLLTVTDEAARECLALEVDSSITDRRVSAAPNRIALFRGLPKEIGGWDCHCGLLLNNHHVGKKRFFRQQSGAGSSRA